MARRYWEKAGRRRPDRAPHRARGAETLRALPAEPDFDLAFIDADKPGYPVYYEEILKRLRPGGVILADNVLWMGRVGGPDRGRRADRGDPRLQRQGRRATRASSA